jgi:hypothetical protein
LAQATSPMCAGVLGSMGAGRGLAGRRRPCPWDPRLRHRGGRTSCGHTRGDSSTSERVARRCWGAHGRGRRNGSLRGRLCGGRGG